MNERIEKLADKIWAEEYWNKPNTDKLLPAQLNKFAELIVRECADLCLKHETFEGLFQRTEYRQGRHFSTMMKAHFGVEE